MKLKHLGFTVFLLLLLIAPKLTLSNYGLEESSVSLGIVGLLIWSIFTPKVFSSLALLKLPRKLMGIVLFSSYALLVSFVDITPISFAYGFQYFIYTFLGVFLVSNYLKNAIKAQQINIVIKIVLFVGLIYAVGVLVSVFTGPIYPDQVQYTVANWGGEKFQRASGFSEGTNLAGGILIFFTSFALSFSSNFARNGSFLVSSLFMLALAATLSRSAIYSFLLATVVHQFILIFSSKLRIRKRVIIGSFLSLVILSLGFYFYSQSGDFDVENIYNAFNIFGDGQLNEEANFRQSLWLQGWNKWLESSIIEKIVGRGFRSSMVLSGGYWITTHNCYIAFLNEFGIVGLVIFISSCFQLLRKSAKRLTKKTDTGFSSFSFVTILGLLIHNLSETFFYSPILLSLVILTFALADLPEPGLSRATNLVQHAIHREELVL